MVDKLFGLKTITKLKCEESGEEISEGGLAYALKCNIASDTNYLHQARARRRRRVCRACLCRPRRPRLLTAGGRRGAVCC